jgi:hypothetical protein
MANATHAAVGAQRGHEALTAITSATNEVDCLELPKTKLRKFLSILLPSRNGIGSQLSDIFVGNPNTQVGQ